MVSAALTVAGWVASPCLRYLGDVIGKYLQDQYEYQKPDVRSKLQSLKREMTKICAVIHEAEKDRIENPALKTWLLDLKDACSDAEDMLDMFEYQILQDKVENMDSGSIASSSRNACKRARMILKRFVFCDDELRELFRIVDRFKQLAEEMGCFINLVMSDRYGPKSTGYQSSEERMPARCSTSISTEPQLFGRDEERTGLIEKLGLKQGKEGELIVGMINVISIVGIGGMGKTTLVQWVYNDEGVRKEFDLIGWVCVSDKFDVRRLMTEMIDSLNIKKPVNLHSIQNLDAIQRILKDGLGGKRFLIVLDDIWERDPGKWDVLRSTINSGKEGSRVIITTRNESIANMMAKDIIHLKGLDDVQYWKLFVRTAFGDVDPDERPDLVSIGRKIVKKLGGLPLAAKVVGGVLNLNMNIRHWNEILTKEVWQVDELEERIISVLRLSYDYLPAHLKQCFVYCSLFHKDYKHKKDDLIQLWAAQGFIQPNHKDVSETMETTGENYLDELVSKSFLQKKIGYKYGNDGLYFMHNLLHDLAIYLSHEELFKAEDAEPDDMPLKIPKRVRHMSIHADRLSVFCNDQIEKKNLRSLVVHHCSTVVGKEIFKELKELKGLRVLILNESFDNLPSKTLRQMLHLRYLKIDGFLEEPESCKLYHLQVLSIRGPLSKRIYRLINLRFVNGRTAWIQNVGRLTFLHELQFSVDREEKGFEISQLGVMSQLRRLRICNLGRVKSVEEASKAKLCTKTNLERLRLVWGQNGNQQSEVLEGLKPHKNLRRLAIEGYSGRCPSWLMGNYLENLQMIDVMGCSSWNVLPPMGHLPLLRELFLRGFPSVEQIGPEFYGGNNNNNNNKAFPSLELLWLEEMPELVEWRIVVEGLELFPRLSHLRVDGCPKLRGPLCLPSPLKRLSVYLSLGASGGGRLLGDNRCMVSCPSSSRLKEWVSYAKLASVEEMEIRAGGTTFLDELEEWFQHLTSLNHLHFTQCRDLQSLPYMLINNLPALCKLEIYFCPNLQSIEVGLPSSLTALEIHGCNAELAQRCRKDGADWHKIAHIPNIRIFPSRDSFDDNMRVRSGVLTMVFRP